MNTFTLPTLFLSHGSPDIAVRDTPASAFLRALGGELPTPRAILVVSAHWIDAPVGITQGAQLRTIHDFGGFQRELYEMEYPAQGDAVLSEQVASLLRTAGIESQISTSRGLDHGAWIPLKLVYPEAQIPVVQLSLPSGSLEELARMGAALEPLRHQGVLIVGSGGSVHNLRALDMSGRTADWAEAFEEWIRLNVEGGRFEHIVEPQRFPAHFRQAHPTLEHYAPLVFAWAAGGQQQPGRRMHLSFDYGNVGMSFYAFGEVAVEAAA